jgi:hypothetical protein
MTDDATLELLLDLKHDLGKYMLLPLSLLPRDADDAAVRDALTRALLQTRTRRVPADQNGGNSAKHSSAAELWRVAAAELQQTGCARESIARIDAAVQRALAWQHALAREGALDRRAIERDLGAVQSTIAELIDEARRD